MEFLHSFLRNLLAGNQWWRFSSGGPGLRDEYIITYFFRHDLSLTCLSRDVIFSYVEFVNLFL